MPTTPFFRTTVAVLLFIILCMWIAGWTDTEDTQYANEQYCANVGAGVWPDYKGVYTQACKDGKIKE